MKTMLSFLLVIILVLSITGCQAAHDPLESTDAPETAPSGVVEPTKDSTVPTTSETYSTHPLVDAPPGFPCNTDYSLAPDGYLPFVYSEGLEYNCNTSECVDGWLYIHYKKTGVVRMFPDEPATSCATTKDHIYYVTEAEPDAVYRSDYTGENRELVFRAEGLALRLYSDYLVDGELSLAIIINDCQAAMYYLERQQLDILMEQAYILKFGFDYETDPYRMMICWHGRVSEGEEGTHPYITYLDTGETEDWNYL